MKSAPSTLGTALGLAGIAVLTLGLAAVGYVLATATPADWQALAAAFALL